MKMTKEQEQGFIAFWSLWKKHVAKTDAMKAWIKIDPKEYQAILAAVPIHFKQPSWNKDGMDYVPYPATWLNGRRWEDELAVRKEIAVSKIEKSADLIIDAIKDISNTYMPKFNAELMSALYSVLRNKHLRWPDLQKQRHDVAFLDGLRNDLLNEMQKKAV